MGESQPEAHVKGWSGRNFTASISNNFAAICFAVSVECTMIQSYRLYANNAAVEVISVDEWGKWVSGYANTDEQEVMRLAAISDWTQFWEKLYSRAYRCTVLLLVEDLTAGWQQVLGHFELLAAAGGIVQNSAGEILMIHRRGKWDFPKGKMEAGELEEEAAIREVQEETGLQDVTIYKQLLLYGHQTASYHTYREKGRWICKPTWWFSMMAPAHQRLQPQGEEDITEAVWKQPEEVALLLADSFSSLQDVWHAWSSVH